MISFKVRLLRLIFISTTSNVTHYTLDKCEYLQDEFGKAADAHELKVRAVKNKYKGLLKDLDKQLQSDMASQEKDLERKFNKSTEQLKRKHAIEVEQINNAFKLLENEMELLNKENEGK